MEPNNQQKEFIIKQILVRDVIKVKQVNPAITSLEIKRLLESLLGFYISNEMFKKCAREFGLREIGNRAAPDNPRYNISNKTIRYWRALDRWQ
ncbi:MAG: hypothetical protein GY861_17975 [bacterium]|nr:hypothetical protein [bacterium]